MAWGFWTTYSSSPYQQLSQQQRLVVAQHHHQQQQLIQQQQQPSPPPVSASSGKRDRSQERDLNRSDRERLLKSSSSGSVHNHDGSVGSTATGSGGGGGGGGASVGSLFKKSQGQVGNHVAVDRAAYERNLLLGDPDWSNRTAADRNTLPRKKDQYDNSVLDRGGSVTPPPGGVSGGEDSVYYSGTGEGDCAKGATPAGSATSRKSSDDVFCPACAHQASSQPNSSNRESRVSFGSVASSSRGSSGGDQLHHGPPRSSRRARRPSSSAREPASSCRTRSRSQEDEDVSSAAGGHLSSSVPTPPPPPFLSQRDLVHTSLMETINQKMSILSSIRNSLPINNANLSSMEAAAAAAASSGGHFAIPPSVSYHHTPLPPRPQTAPRRRHSGSRHVLPTDKGNPTPSPSSNHHHYNARHHRSHSSKSHGSAGGSSSGGPKHSSSLSLKDQQESHLVDDGQHNADAAMGSPLPLSAKPSEHPLHRNQSFPSHPRSSRSSSRTTPPHGSSSRASRESVKSGGESGSKDNSGQEGRVPSGPPSRDEKLRSKSNSGAEEDPGAAKGSYERLGEKVDDGVVAAVEESDDAGGSVIGIRKATSFESRSTAQSQTGGEEEHAEEEEDGNESGDERSIQEGMGTVRRRQQQHRRKASIRSKSSSQERLREARRDSQERVLKASAEFDLLLDRHQRRVQHRQQHSDRGGRDYYSRYRYQHSRSQENIDHDSSRHSFSHGSSGGSRYSSRERLPVPHHHHHHHPPQTNDAFWGAADYHHGGAHVIAEPHTKSQEELAIGHRRNAKGPGYHHPYPPYDAYHRYYYQQQVPSPKQQHGGAPQYHPPPRGYEDQQIHGGNLYVQHSTITPHQNSVFGQQRQPHAHSPEKLLDLSRYPPYPQQQQHHQRPPPPAPFDLGPSAALGKSCSSPEVPQHPLPPPPQHATSTTGSEVSDKEGGGGGDGGDSTECHDDRDDDESCGEQTSQGEYIRRMTYGLRQKHSDGGEAALDSPMANLPSLSCSETPPPSGHRQQQLRRPGSSSRGETPEEQLSPQVAVGGSFGMHDDDGVYHDDGCARDSAARPRLRKGSSPPPPPPKEAFFTRPRSASTGDRLSDGSSDHGGDNEPYHPYPGHESHRHRHQRHHDGHHYHADGRPYNTLDSRSGHHQPRYHQHHHQHQQHHHYRPPAAAEKSSPAFRKGMLNPSAPPADRRLVAMSSFRSTLPSSSMSAASSRSGKSSSRSSKTPSVENVKPVAGRTLYSRAPHRE